MSAEMRVKKKGQDRELPLLFLSLWQKNQGRYRPDTKEETKYGPKIFRVSIVISEEATHNRVEKMNDEGSS